MERFTLWSEAITIKDITTDTVAFKFYSEWFANLKYHSVSPQIVDDSSNISCSKFWKTLLAPTIYTRYYIICHRIGLSNDSTEVFRLSFDAIPQNVWLIYYKLFSEGFVHPSKKISKPVLLNSYMVKPLAYPETFSTSRDYVDPATFVGRLRDHISSIRPVSTSLRTGAIFVHNVFSSCSHVFFYGRMPDVVFSNHLTQDHFGYYPAVVKPLLSN